MKISQSLSDKKTHDLLQQREQVVYKTSAHDYFEIDEACFACAKTRADISDT